MKPTRCRVQFGQGMAEYALIIAIIVLGAILGLVILGVDVQGLYCNIVSSIGFRHVARTLATISII